jgi:hypothetical protein
MLAIRAVDMVAEIRRTTRFLPSFFIPSNAKIARNPPVAHC